MDGKAKKTLGSDPSEIAAVCKQQLAGAKKQMDDVEEVSKLEKEIAALEAEATKFWPVTRVLIALREMTAA